MADEVFLKNQWLLHISGILVNSVYEKKTWCPVDILDTFLKFSWIRRTQRYRRSILGPWFVCSIFRSVSLQLELTVRIFVVLYVFPFQTNPACISTRPWPLPNFFQLILEYYHSTAFGRKPCFIGNKPLGFLTKIYCERKIFEISKNNCRKSHEYAKCCICKTAFVVYISGCVSGSRVTINYWWH
jgi:hypothetical protein